MHLNFNMQFSSTGQDIKFSFYHKITQITPVNNMQVYCEYMDIENWGAMKRTPHVLRSIKARLRELLHLECELVTGTINLS